MMQKICEALKWLAKGKVMPSDIPYLTVGIFLVLMTFIGASLCCILFFVILIKSLKNGIFYLLWLIPDIALFSFCASVIGYWTQKKN